MRKSMAVAAFTAVLVAGGAYGVAQDAIKRTPLQKSEFPAGHESHIMEVTVAPGGIVARHTHPGIEMGYVVEGEAILTVDGKDIALKPGTSYAVPAGVIHSAKSTGTTPIKIIGTFVVEKGKPLATPAPR